MRLRKTIAIHGHNRSRSWRLGWSFSPGRSHSTKMSQSWASGKYFSHLTLGIRT